MHTAETVWFDKGWWPGGDRRRPFQGVNNQYFQLLRRLRALPKYAKIGVKRANHGWRITGGDFLAGRSVILSTHWPTSPPPRGRSSPGTGHRCRHGLSSAAGAFQKPVGIVRCKRLILRHWNRPGLPFQKQVLLEERRHQRVVTWLGLFRIRRGLGIDSSSCAQQGTVFTTPENVLV